MDKKRLIALYVLVLALVLIAAIPDTYAITMKLLAVSKSEAGLVGTDADLELEVKPGSGRVFISTFPLTNVDTQVSFRMAQEYACDFLDRDCTGYDFYYVINSNAPIIGGPSAGAPATALTIIALDNLKLNKSIAATGTINSGGIIGPVAGIKQKIEAASGVGLTKVIIPEGTRYAEADEIIELNNSAAESSNLTLDLVEYGLKKGVAVVEASDINAMVYELTGKRYPVMDGNLEISPMYSEIMENISLDLCKRGEGLLELIDPELEDEYLSELESAENLTKLAEQAYNEGFYYSSASYCYGANVKYRYISLLQKSPDKDMLSILINATRRDIKTLSKSLDDSSYDTINDLQTYLVVSERLSEADSYLDDAIDSLDSKSLDDPTYSISLAIERVYSAYYWSKFFGQGGRKFDLKDETLARFCLEKVSEADERIQYINSIVLLSMDSLQRELSLATLDYEAGRYGECIFKASKVNARANLVMNAIGLQEKDFSRVLEHKIEKARQTIIKETKREVFPILGYSYYEYAQSLKEEDPASALLYSELSLELSSFDMYLEPLGTQRLYRIEFPNYMYFLGGMIIGYTIAMLLLLAVKINKRLKEKRSAPIHQEDDLPLKTSQKKNPPLKTPLKTSLKKGGSASPRRK